MLNNICLDAVYLDTTYCHRKYRFPRQDQAIQRIVDIVQNTIKDEDSNENICTSRNTLYLIATYGIGKERIIDALVQRGYRMYTSPDKWQVLQCIEYWDSCPFHSSFTTDPSASPIWLVGWNRVTESVPGRLLCNFEALEEMLYMANKSRTHSNPCLGDMPLQRVVALVPTGWTWQKHGGEYFQEKDHSRLCVYGIPYSEHSNYEELYDFVAWLRPKQVIPTVTFSKTPTKHPFHHLLAATQVKRTFLQNWLSKPQQPSDNKHPMKCEKEQSQSKLAKKCDILSYFSTSSNH